MARTKRRQDADLLRHVYSRGNNRQRIFADEEDFQKFSFLLLETVDDFDVQCWDFCMMHTHYHLALYNERENLSDALEFLNGEYARWWNRRHGHVGHVFERPFQDQVVEEETYCKSLARYIARNPVRAGLVQRPEDWPWSAYRYLAGFADPPEFLSCEPVLRQFVETDLQTARQAYVECVMSDVPRDRLREEAFRSRQRVVGSREFKRFKACGRKRSSTQASATEDSKPDSIKIA